MSAPWLSVLIPSYNGAKYLRAALDSVLAQDRDGIEGILVDDGSTDATLSIAEAYRHRMDLKVIERPRQGNWVANTNLALREARGRYASVLHQDDCWADGRIAAMRPLIDNHPDAEFFLHASRFIDRRGAPLGHWTCPLPPAPRVLAPETVLPRLLVQNFVAMPAPIFSVRVARIAGGLDETLRYTADWDLWLKLAAVARTVYHPEPLCCFRIHPEAQTARLSRDLDRFRAQQQVVFDRHLPLISETGSATRGYLRAGRFSIAANTALAAADHGRRAPLFWVGCAFIALGPTGWIRYWRCSRIWQRVVARLKARRRASASPSGRVAKRQSVAATGEPATGEGEIVES